MKNINTPNKKFYIPQFKTRDVIFISKKNALGEKIKIAETIRMKVKNPFGKISKKFTHIAVSQSNALFIETGVNTGAIQTVIDALLDNPDIDAWEVYRHNQVFDTQSDKKYFDTINEEYYHTLYNTSFFSTEDESRDSYFCSQLATIILSESDLLKINNTNIGPTELYSYIKTAQTSWKEVTTEYQHLLYSSDFTSQRQKYLHQARVFASAQSVVSFSEKQTLISEAMLNNQKKKLKNLKPFSATNRLASSGPINSLFNQFPIKDKERARKNGELPKSVLDLEGKFQLENDFHTTASIFEKLTNIKEIEKIEVFNLFNDSYLELVSQIKLLQNKKPTLEELDLLEEKIIGTLTVGRYYISLNTDKSAAFDETVLNRFNKLSSYLEILVQLKKKL